MTTQTGPERTVGQLVADATPDKISDARPGSPNRLLFTGTGGGVSIRHEDHIFLAPSGVEKELMQPDNIFVMDWASKEYIRRPLVGLVDF